MKLRAAVAVLCLAAVKLTSCSPEPARSRLETVPLPAELEALDLPSRQLFEHRHQIVDRLLRDPLASDRQLSRAFGDLGMVFHAYEDYAAAELCYRNATALDPGEFRWRYYLGRAAAAQGRLQDSQDLLERALELRPGDVPTLVWLAVGALELNHTAVAEARFREALKRDSSCVRAMVGLGSIAHQQGDYRAALDYLEAAFSRQPQAASIRYALALAYSETGDFERAREHRAAVSAQSLRQNSISLHDPLGNAIGELQIGAGNHDRRAVEAAAQGRHALAAAEFRQSLAADPGRVHARYGLASALLQLGRRDEAVAELGDLLRSAPSHAPAHLLLAKVHAGDGQLEPAEEHLRSALAAEPDSAEAYFELAGVVRDSDRLDAALQYYEQATERAPDLELPRFWAVVVLSWQGRHAEARRALETHLAVLPGSAALAMLGARLLAAAPEPSSRDGEQALVLARRAVDSDATVAATVSMAMALAELGRFKQAIDWQRRAVTATGLPERELLRARERLSFYRQGRPCREPWDRDERLIGVHLDPAQSPIGQSARPPGTERMARRLAAIARDAQPMRNNFMNRGRLALLGQREPPFELRERAQFELRLANELLRAGHPAAAAERFADLAELAREKPAELSPDFRRRVHSLLATAHLRLGEQENCLERHTAGACLLPISDADVHRLERGSRAALEELAGLLREDPEDLESRWLYNLAAMTLGEYPEGVPAEWLIPPETFDSEHDVGHFADAAPAIGLATVGLAGGAVVDDLDGDGYLDVMVSSWGLTDPLRFFRNRGGDEGGIVTFEERTRESGLEGIVSGLNLVHADYDNDGDHDVLVLRGAWLAVAGRHPNSLLRNRGVGADGMVSFEDVTEEAGLLDFHPTQTAAWGDFDNDGWLDLFVGNESLPGDPHPCQLFRNNGPGAGGEVTFTDIAHDAGVDAGGDVKGVVWGDVDNDGWLDLYLSRLLEPNLLFHNQGAMGSATFREIASEAGVSEPENSFPTWFFDFDNDGWLDLFVSGYPRDYLSTRAASVVADSLGLPTSAETPRLYRNRSGEADGNVSAAGSKRRISFSDVTAATGLDHVLLAMGVNFGDLDNDGWLDFYLGTGAPDYRVLIPNRMFRNAAGRGFQDVTTSGGFGHLQKGHGVAFADLDNDGDQDVFAVIGGAFSGDVYQNMLFANPGHGHRWITLRFTGTRSNRAAIGARVQVELETPEGPRQVHVTVGTGGSFGSSSLQQEIGLGNATAVRAVEVWWPGGGREVFRDLNLDRIYRLVEGDPDPAVVAFERLELPGSSGAAGPRLH